MSELPEIWWSPSLAAKSLPGQAYAGLMWRYKSGEGYTTPKNLPDDAVRLVTTADRQDRDARLMDALVKSEAQEAELEQLRTIEQRARNVHELIAFPNAEQTEFASDVARLILGEE